MLIVYIPDGPSLHRGDVVADDHDRTKSPRLWAEFEVRSE